MSNHTLSNYELKYSLFLSLFSQGKSIAFFKKDKIRVYSIEIK